MTIEERVEAALTKAESTSKTLRARMRDCVFDEVVELFTQIQQDADTLVRRANENVERAVNNAYEDAKAVCMGLHPPAHDAVEAIGKRQQTVLGIKPDKTQGDDAPIDPSLWGSE